MASAHQAIEDRRVSKRSLRKATPEAWAGFSHLTTPPPMVPCRPGSRADGPLSLS